MYIDIPANDNVPEATMATFKETGPSRALRSVRLWRDGVWQWCAITGWSEAETPTTALITPIEESGDGPALLIHGGDYGLRLTPLAESPRWDLADDGQWGEPFLLCRPDTEFVVA